MMEWRMGNGMENESEWVWTQQTVLNWNNRHQIDNITAYAYRHHHPSHISDVIGTLIKDLDNQMVYK